jgi:hypothetical protein
MRSIELWMIVVVVVAAAAVSTVVPVVAVVVIVVGLRLDFYEIARVIQLKLMQLHPVITS